MAIVVKGNGIWLNVMNKTPEIQAQRPKTKRYQWRKNDVGTMSDLFRTVSWIERSHTTGVVTRSHLITTAQQKDTHLKSVKIDFNLKIIN